MGFMERDASDASPRNTWADLVCVLLGLAQALSLAWPFEGPFKGTSFGGLQMLSMGAFAWMLTQSTHAKSAFLKGWLFSLAWLIGSTWWLFISMHTYGGLSIVWACLAVFALSAGLALIYGAACVVFRLILGVEGRVVSPAFAFAAIWTLAEIVRGTLWTGFPWGAVGYAHIDGQLQHWAPWVGVYGVCFLAAFFSMGAARVIQMNRSISPIEWGTLALILAGLSWTWSASPSQSAHAPESTRAPLRVSLLQGNIPQDLKFGAGVSRALRDYRQALLASQSDLTVTPETALPLTPEQLPDRYWSEIEAHFSSGSQAALIGLPLSMRNAQGQRQYSNSALGLMPQATPASTARYQYDKHHLVPFGEFVPPLFQWFVRQLNIPLGEFTRGDIAQPTLNIKGERIAPNICYEDLFGEELARSFIDPDIAPTFMVNLSNIAWFGDTVAIDQHLNISRMRALEMGRPMLRATNTGATAVINERGEVTHRLPSAVSGVLTAEVYGVHGPVTPYARWVAVAGLWPLIAVAVFILCVIGIITRRSAGESGRFAP